MSVCRRASFLNDWGTACRLADLGPLAVAVRMAVAFHCRRHSGCAVGDRNSVLPNGLARAGDLAARRRTGLAQGATSSRTRCEEKGPGLQHPAGVFRPARDSIEGCLA